MAGAVLGRVLPAGVPVDPDAAEAQRWAEEELAKGVYVDGPTLWERFLEWLLGPLETITGVDAPPLLVPVLVVVAFVLVLVLARVLGGRVRATRARGEAEASVPLFEDARSSAQLHASADAAAARGDYASAVLERFRALVRSLDERGVIDERPGLTAHEAAELAAAALPGAAGELVGAGRLFDDVCYGHAGAGPDEDARLRDLALRVETTATAHAPVPDAGWAGVS